MDLNSAGSAETGQILIHPWWSAFFQRKGWKVSTQGGVPAVRIQLHSREHLLIKKTIHLCVLLIALLAFGVLLQPLSVFCSPAENQPNVLSVEGKKWWWYKHDSPLKKIMPFVPTEVGILGACGARCMKCGVPSMQFPCLICLATLGDSEKLTGCYA